jgi:hypothetical protein
MPIRFGLILSIGVQIGPAFGVHPLGWTDVTPINRRRRPGACGWQRSASASGRKSRTLRFLCASKNRRAHWISEHLRCHLPRPDYRVVAKHNFHLSTRSPSSSRTAASLATAFDQFRRPRTLALGHVKTPLPGVGTTARRATQTPRRPNGAGAARGASRSGQRPCLPCTLCLRRKSSAKSRRSERGSLLAILSAALKIVC